MRIENVEEPVIFDTDCLLAFASVEGGLDLIAELFPSAATTTFVLEEIRYRSHAAHANILNAIKRGRLGTYQMPPGDEAQPMFEELTDPKRALTPGLKVLGDGEAAAIAFVKTGGGTVGSNNLSDIAALCHQEKLQFICSDDILSIAVVKGHISIGTACNMWNQIRASTRLPNYDFNEAYRRFQGGLGR